MFVLSILECRKKSNIFILKFWPVLSMPLAMYDKRKVNERTIKPGVK